MDVLHNPWCSHEGICKTRLKGSVLFEAPCVSFIILIPKRQSLMESFEFILSFCVISSCSWLWPCPVLQPKMSISLTLLCGNRDLIQQTKFWFRCLSTEQQLFPPQTYELYMVPSLKAKEMQKMLLGWGVGGREGHNMTLTNNTAVKVKNIALPVNKLDNADGLNLMRVPC